MNRRKFLKDSTLAATALMVVPGCMPSTTGKMKYEIGVQLYTVRDAMMSDPLGTLEKVAKIGYKKIETASYDAGRAYGYTAKEFKSVLDDLGLKLISGHVSQSFFENSFEEVVGFCVEAGQEYIVFPWLPAEERATIDQYKGHAATLNRCGELAKNEGLTVCYHNHAFEFEPIEGQLPMDILLKETDPELVKIELDLYWVNKAGYDPLKFFSSNEGRIPLWHVKDMADTPEQGFAEVGEGTIDFRSIFANKEVSGMKHFFVEQDQSNDPLKSIETSYNNLTQKILV